MGKLDSLLDNLVEGTDTELRVIFCLVKFSQVVGTAALIYLLSAHTGSPSLYWTLDFGREDVTGPDDIKKSTYRTLVPLEPWGWAAFATLALCFLSAAPSLIMEVIYGGPWVRTASYSSVPAGLASSAEYPY
jgi:hypothetical protein